MNSIADCVSYVTINKSYYPYYVGPAESVSSEISIITAGLKT
jgi:hypothetical protein